MRAGWIKWAIFIPVALWLVWRIAVVNLSQHLANENAEAALRWKRDTPDALLLQGAGTARSNPMLALSIATEAALQNPADGRVYTVLALLLEQEGRHILAEKSAGLADFLAPRRSEVQLQLGNFWARRGQLAEALLHWSKALEMRPTLSDTLFPAMLTFAETPGGRRAYTKMLSDPPEWWADFFNYALRNSADPETLKALYNARAHEKTGVGQAERKAYLDYLLNTGRWTEAYFVWLNGLDARQMSFLGNIYDGGFELPLSDEGYGWRPQSWDGLLLAPEPTYGSSGEKALHVALLKQPPQTRLLHQPLLLDAGHYRLHGRVRLDNLAAGRGLYWTVTCSGAMNDKPLAASEHFIGTDHWKDFAFELMIPAGKCEAQLLNLEVDLGAEAGIFSGSAWFDELALEKLD